MTVTVTKDLRELQSYLLKHSRELTDADVVRMAVLGRIVDANLIKLRSEK